MILIILNIIIIYLAFLIGKNQTILTNSQISCLTEGVSSDQIFVSQEQAMCLAKKGEIEKICGSGCPLFREPADSAILSLKSNKSVLLKNNIEFENQARNLGIIFLQK